MSIETSIISRLTNGRYHVNLSESGSGSSLYEWIALNRWAGDPLEDSNGFFLYLRDVETGQLWSAGRQPTLAEPDSYNITHDDKSFHIERSDCGIASKMSVQIDSNDSVETRRLLLQNQSSHVRKIEITSCIEIALAHPQGDLGHPAFSKLFVQTELMESVASLVAKRRPRSEGESWHALFHALTGAATEAWETDRRHFIGRGRTLANPAMKMNGNVGNVLDPLFSLRTTIILQPNETREICFLLGAVADHQQLASVVKKHAASAHLSPSMQMASPSARRASGKFQHDDSEYAIHLPWSDGRLSLPPMPWCNVIANENFGCLVTERGAGCTWSRNSQANRLTPWSNDPVSDPHDEALYLQDALSGEFWSPLPGPCPAGADYHVAHGFGYSQWRVEAHDICHETTIFVDRHEPIKFCLVRITNNGNTSKPLHFTSYHRLVMGSLAGSNTNIITSKITPDILTASHGKTSDFSNGIAFSFGVFRGSEITACKQLCDRREFLGEYGTTRRPDALNAPFPGNQTEHCVDPCFSHQWSFTLAPGQSIECAIALGEALSQTQVLDLHKRFHDMQAIIDSLENIRAFWKHGLGGIKVKTPSAEIDRLANGWLAYQALSCRMWARTAFYQSSGAFGFRDQLQDAGNLSLLWPEISRKQILLHARHQFIEGDVLHWWHEAPIDRGVRTRFSDDLLWLPFVAKNYVDSTGDDALWEEMEAFLRAPLLADSEDENYLKPIISQECATIYEHCCRAIDRSLTVGVHGLPLMGTGDWNDGMNRVGREGRGESVWLGFFLYQILESFIPLCQNRKDQQRAELYMIHQKNLHAALNDAGWDGEWYRRAYYDNGAILGTKEADECRIDGLAQSWSVLSGVASPERAESAMNAAEKYLISQDQRLIRLLTPPFVNTKEDPGYIKGYVAGVRENGGQYTHAASWMIQAFAKMGRRDKAAALLAMISPSAHTRTQKEIDCYKVEPYVIAADVYGAEPHIGRGGWTWYTGSAGWIYKVAIESILGLSIKRGDTIVIQPCIPDEWEGYEIIYRDPVCDSIYHITIQNPNQCSAKIISATMDLIPLTMINNAAHIPLTSKKETHHVVITMGS